MACKCLERQRWIVERLCKHGLTRLCQLAMARLAKMEASQQ